MRRDFNARHLFFNFILVVFCEGNIRRDWEGDVLMLPDLATCLHYAPSALWHESTKSCSCKQKETFYSLNESIYGCFEGSGSNMGCSLELIKNSVLIIQNNGNKKFSQRKSWDYKFNLLMLMNWDVYGWQNVSGIAVKIDSKEIAISWLNQDYDKSLSGKLFKVVVQNQSKTDCFLFKALGTAELFYPLTKPPIEVTTAAPVFFKSKCSDSKGIVLGMGAGLGVLLLVIIAGIILYWRQRSRLKLKSVSNVKNKCITNINYNTENIYDAVGSTTTGLCRSETMPKSLLHQADDSYLVPNFMLPSNGIILPRRLHSSTGTEQLLNNNTLPYASLDYAASVAKPDTNDHIYLPASKNYFIPPNETYTEALVMGTLPLPKVPKTEVYSRYSKLETKFEVEAYEALQDLKEPDNLRCDLSALNTNKSDSGETNSLAQDNCEIRNNSFSSNETVRHGSPFYFETVRCYSNASFDDCK